MRDADIVIGFHAVLAVLEHEPERVEVILVAAGGGRANRVRDLARKKGVRIRSTGRKDLDEIAGGVVHNGFAARVAPTSFADVDDLLALPAPVCLLGLDTLEDPHNLGAVIRIAAAFDLGGVIVSGPHPPPLGGAAAKVAAGALPLVRIAHVGSLGDVARSAKKAGFWVWGADTAGEPVAGVDLSDKLLLCIGAEGPGLRAKTRAALDGTVAVPISTKVESLNLSVSTGILAWEWRRKFPL